MSIVSFLKEEGRIFFILLKMNFVARTQYRAAFFASLATATLWVCIDILWLVTLFARFEYLVGWSFWEVAFLLGLGCFGFSIGECLTSGFKFSNILALNGNIDRMLLRPGSMIMQIVGSHYDLDDIGRGLPGVVLLGIACVKMKVSLDFYVALAFAEAVICTAVLYFSLFVIQGAFGIRWLQRFEFWNIFTHGGRNMAYNPSIIYKGFLRHLFTWVIPSLAVAYYPTLAILHKTDDLLMVQAYFLFVPLLAIVMLFVAVGVWIKAMNSYSPPGS